MPRTEPKPLDLEPMYAFERTWENRVGAKDAAIRSEFGVPAARYYQALYAALDTTAALEHDPMLTHRLIRLRDSRREARARRTFRRN